MKTSRRTLLKRGMMLPLAPVLLQPLLAACAEAEAPSGPPSGSPGPVPIPASESVLRFPADHYLHIGAPTEWWWHIGTLKAGNRTFGFEINAASFQAYGFTQVMLTDVSGKRHFQQTAGFAPPTFNAGSWAESDPSKPWFVKLGDVSMTSPQNDPSKDMEVTADLVDEATKTEVSFDLKFSQKGPPFIVWGKGVTSPPVEPTLQTNNFYYSLTRLMASGSVTVDGEQFEVTGVTWMDHEYGLFGTEENRPKWILQDMQLTNGVCLSNYSVEEPALNKKVASMATVQRQDGTTYFVESFVKPVGSTWTSPESGQTYFMEIEVEIPAFEAMLTVKSLLDPQEFPLPLGAVYEGVASAWGTFEGVGVSGTAWSEQTSRGPASAARRIMDVTV
jgi:predicted secreted hydrolase